MTFITVCLEVSCLFRFTPGTNYGAHRIQLHDGGLIICWRRIRKVDENKQTDREHTENSKPEAALIPVDHRGEWANIFYSVRSYKMVVIFNIWILDSRS